MCIKQFLFCALTALSLTFNLSANDSTLGIIHHYYKERLNNLSANGRVKLEGTYIKGPLEVNGSVSAEDARIGTTSINGHVTFNNSTVDGVCTVSGFLQAEKTTFKNKIEVTAHKVVFTDCTLDSLVVHKTFWPLGKQVVELSHSTCKGNISFDSGKGYVHLSKDSKVLGSVEGAEVVQTLSE